MKIYAMSKTAKGSVRLGILSLNISDFLNSHMSEFNTTGRLERCEDKRATVAYSIRFDMVEEGNGEQNSMVERDGSSDAAQ